jgi:Uma2 family endonuclease
MQAVESLPNLVRGAKLWPLSVEAYHVLGEAGLIPENTELLYGFVYTKMPKSPQHTFLLQAVFEMLGRSMPQGLWIRTEQPLVCGDSEPEPDIAVVTGSKENFRLAHPNSAELVVEICITSHEYDRSKLRAYANAGVKECWCVLQPEQRVEVYRKPGNGEFAERLIHGPKGIIASAALPTLKLDLAELFAK